MSDSAGMVGGRYRLVRTIGQGGMGTVWQAHDEVLGRDVAVKEVLPPPDLTGPEREVFTVRTFREARAAGRVAHPGVATVYDVLEEHGHPWIVMQLVRSRTLGEIVRDDGPLPPRQVADLGLQLLEALRAAHAAGVLHRDVKPDNVLIAEDGRAVLTDFGIATTEDEAPVTRTGVLVGTPAFMAPERAAGGQARPASDLWSLGVTLYVAVEGHSPFHRPHALATLGAVMHAEPEPLARAGVLAPVLHGLMRKDPAERMSLEEAEHRLGAILTGHAPDQTGPVPIPRTESRAAGGRGRPLAAIAAGALVVGVATGGLAWWSNRPGDAHSPAPAVVSTPSTVIRTETTTPAATPTFSPSGPETSTLPPLPEQSAPSTRTQPRSPSRSDGETERPTPTKTKSDDDKDDDGKKDDKPSQTPGQIEPESAGAKQSGKGKKD
ncbi:protein kinase [Nonomuraea sp. NN258]|uniref:serine/threonine-protein kinase n=1 Tax=Nonomuraea antri TaxID=2730852 RepID=UPI001567FD2F|nr:serine/threonine-protein kinase [Nonomuraea antri]NRQ36543.1 protein kinase [Nonomuraea antri]